jgi:hypothetical protein
MTTISTLAQVQQYGLSQAIIERYDQDYSDNGLDGSQALAEVIKFLWLVAKHGEDRSQNPKLKKLNFDVVLHSEMADIDDMWHTFILFTHDYTQFCLTHFGRYIHHQPTPVSQKLQIQASHVDAIDALTPWLNYVYDNLGPETLKLWFKKYF